MEAITEQRHEHLTEEEKKISTQIRSVAVTLYEKKDLDKPTVKFLREHFFKDPTLALAYFYCCSTDPHQKQPHVPYCVGIFMFQLVGTCKGLLMSFSHRYMSISNYWS